MSLLEFRKELYAAELDLQAPAPDNVDVSRGKWRQLAALLRSSDQHDEIEDMLAVDSAEELMDGVEMRLLARWLEHGRWECPVPGMASSRWSRIRYIDVSGSNLSHDLCGCLFDAIAQTPSPHIMELNVSSNRVGGYADEDDFFIPVPTAGVALANMLSKNRSLTTLHARYIQIGMHTASAIARAIEKDNRSLTYLDVSQNSIWFDEVNVDELESDRHFSREAVDCFSRAIYANEVLTRILISSTDFQTDELTGRNLAGTVEDPTFLNYSDRRASRCDILLIVNSMRRETPVRRLDLSNKVVDAICGDALVSLMEDPGESQLERINLSSIQCSVTTSLKLAEAALGNPQLKFFTQIPIHKLRLNMAQSIMLKNSGIGVHGAITLARCLATNTSVVNLYLSECNIGTEGAAAFSTVLRTNCTLKFMDLRRNMIQERALASWNEALRERLANAGTLPLAMHTIGKYFHLSTPASASNAEFGKLAMLLLTCCSLRNRFAGKCDWRLRIHPGAASPRGVCTTISAVY